MPTPEQAKRARAARKGWITRRREEQVVSYRLGGSAVQAAWFAYKRAHPGRAMSVVDFVAGYNAARRK